MRPAPLYVLPCLFAVLLAAVPPAFGQAKSAAPAAPGWGSTWMEPANDQMRQQQEWLRQCAGLQKAGNFQGIIALCDHHLQTRPEDAGAYIIRANANRRLKRFDEALADVDHARTITEKKGLPDETAQTFVYRATVDESRKDYPAAISDLQTALKLNGKNINACNNLAWLRATAPDGNFRDGRESVRLAQKALALESPANAFGAADTLAAAYAESNDYPQAVANEKRAIDVAGKQIKDAAKAQKFQKEAAERLQLFEQHQPYHADLP